MQNIQEEQPHIPLEIFFSPEDETFKSEHSEEAKRASPRLRAGYLCPKCNSERLDYDGLLNLVCPKCGLVSGGCFT
jgi:hypothetical protein